MSDLNSNIMEYDAVIELCENITKAPSIVNSFTEYQMISLAHYWTKSLKTQRLLVDVPNDKILVVGDVHGDLLQVKRALQLLDENQISIVVFDGDVVDRGVEMIECLMLILSYQLKYPGKIYYLRGNHEIASVNEVYGFRGYMTAIYSSRTYDSYKKAFQELPYAMKVSDWAFITHGGIPKDQIFFHLMRLDLKPKEPQQGAYSELLWNDPHVSTKGFAPSYRGRYCYRFGEDVFNEFMDFHNLDLFVRAHQAYPLGYRWFFDDRLLTIFSSKAGPYARIDPHFVILDQGRTELIDAASVEIEF
ncbi:MAG: metallophosphoesterase [Candidatus Kariarchaeaceae archaeon]|jgi:diadenosine tetraphosphatase ApaH/serine/threonine PP2A family protein phosphatase